MEQASGPVIAEVDIAVTGMTCAACVARVEKKLSKVPGADVTVNLATERAHIELTEDVPTDDLVAIVEKAGYGATPIRRINIDDAGKRESQDSVGADQVEAAAEAAAQARVADLWRRFVISAILTIPIVALSMFQSLQFDGWQWIVGSLSLPVAFWCGWPFHRGAFRAGRYGSSTMDTLVSLGVLASMGWSLWALLFGGAGAMHYRMSMTGIAQLGHGEHPHLYFESAAMIVTFLLIGRWLEARSRHSAGDALRALIELGADDADLVTRADGTADERTIPASELIEGDVFRVRPGQTIATDGVVIEGESAVDASLVTGESVPVEVGVGDAVTGATINTHGTLLVRATRVGEETTLAQMGRLLAEAQTGKAPVQRLVDRISSVFVPIVIGIALATFLTRIFIFNNPLEMALASAITVLVVACPCALGLATPTALLVGSGRLSELGVLIKGPQILENAHSIDTIVLDKTGTLTSAKMSVADVVADDSELVLSLAAGLEKNSEHPVARAIVDAASARGITPASIESFKNVAGNGVIGIASDAPVRAGTLRWLESEGVEVSGIRAQAERLAETGATVVVVSQYNMAIGVISVTDTLRPESAQTVADLKDRGITPILATGDNEQTAREVASAVGIDDVRAGVLPEGKVDVVTELQSSGKKVAMVGDGVNDAAALAGADLSIAIGSGTDVAKASADITIVNSNISTIPTALRVSAKTLRIIRENLLWAFGYNLLAIPLAVFGIIVPGIAAAAMAGSSVIVVANSLRLRNAR